MYMYLHVVYMHVYIQCIYMLHVHVHTFESECTGAFQVVHVKVKYMYYVAQCERGYPYANREGLKQWCTHCIYYSTRKMSPYRNKATSGINY